MSALRSMALIPLLALSLSGCGEPMDEQVADLEEPGFDDAEYEKADATTSATQLRGFLRYGDTATGTYVAAKFAGYEFPARKGAVVSLEAVGSYSSGADPTLFLYGPPNSRGTRALLAKNDNKSASSKDAALDRITLPADGIYLLITGEKTKRGGGTFRVSVGCRAGNCADDLCGGLLPVSCEAKDARCVLSGSLGQCLTPPSTGYGVTVRVQECYDHTCSMVSGITCASFSIETETGTPVVRDYTALGGAINFKLLRGRYVARLYKKDGTAGRMEGGSLGSPTTVPAVIKFDVPGQSPSFLVRERADEYMSCANVRLPVKALDPDGQPMRAPDTEWALWGRIIDMGGNVKAEGWTRSFMNGPTGNALSFMFIPAGKYKIVVHQLDVPGYMRRNNPDIESYVRSYDQGELARVPVTVSTSQVGKDFYLPAKTFQTMP